MRRSSAALLAALAAVLGAGAGAALGARHRARHEPRPRSCVAPGATCSRARPRCASTKRARERAGEPRGDAGVPGRAPRPHDAARADAAEPAHLARPASSSPATSPPISRRVRRRLRDDQTRRGRRRRAARAALDRVGLLRGRRAHLPRSRDPVRPHLARLGRVDRDAQTTIAPPGRSRRLRRSARRGACAPRQRRGDRRRLAGSRGHDAQLDRRRPRAPPVPTAARRLP